TCVLWNLVDGDVGDEEVAQRQEVTQIVQVLITGQPRLLPLGTVDARVVPQQGASRELPALLRGTRQLLAQAWSLLSSSSMVSPGTVSLGIVSLSSSQLWSSWSASAVPGAAAVKSASSTGSSSTGSPSRVSPETVSPCDG